MIVIALRCPYCQSEQRVKYGMTPNGKPRYRCRTWGRQHREHPGSQADSAAARDPILRAYEERSRLRGLSRTFGVSRNTVTAWLKKSPESTAAGDDLDRRSTGRCLGTG